jgi:hypothetical protein
MKYRSNTPDAPNPYKAKIIKPGTVPANKIPVLDRKGRLRGQVGHLATAITARRFLNGRNATLQKKNGRDVWQETIADASAQGSATPGATGNTLADVSSKGATATVIKAGG